MSQQEVAALLDRLPEKVRYAYFFIRREGDEVWYTLKDQVLSDRLKEIKYPKTLNELKPVERNSLERECWELLNKKFG